MRPYICTLSLWVAFVSTALGQLKPETNLVPVPRQYLASASIRLIPPTPRYREVQQTALPTVIQSAAMETVKVRAGVGTVGYGSGVHIGGGYILSCYHTVRGTQVGTCSVQWPGGSWVRAEIVAKIPQYDLTLKRVSLSSVPAGRRGVGVAVRKPQRGEPLWLIGYPRGERLSYWHGQANGAEYGKDFGINRWVIPGYSGGPAIDNNGRVIGVNVASDYADRQSETISVGPGAINDLLRPFGSAIANARQVQCGGGSCNPYGGSSGGYGGSPSGGYGQQVPITPAIPETPSVQPQPITPASPQQQYVLPIQPVDIDQLRDEIIAEVIAKLPKPRDGVDGKDGERGPPGSTATITQDHINQIAAMVAAQFPAQPTTEEIARAVQDRLPPITLIIRDSAGEIVDTDTVPLGGNLDLQLVPQTVTR